MKKQDVQDVLSLLFRIFCCNRLLHGYRRCLTSCVVPAPSHPYHMCVLLSCVVPAPSHPYHMCVLLSCVVPAPSHPYHMCILLSSVEPGSNPAITGLSVYDLLLYLLLHTPTTGVSYYLL